MARAAAMRLLAELTGRPALHTLLASSGAAAALAAQGAQLARHPCPLSHTSFSSATSCCRCESRWLRRAPAGSLP